MKQTQGGNQNGETRKHILNERTKQSSRKITLKSGDKQLNKYRVENTNYKNAQSFQWKCQQKKEETKIKKGNIRISQKWGI